MRTIIGIDPGTAVLGYAIITVLSPNELRIESVGVVQLKKYDDHYDRLSSN